VSGRAQIRAAAEYVIGQGGAWRLDHVLANDQWATVVLTRTRDSWGRKVSNPWVWLLDIRNGQVVSETDIYDAHTWRW
jgi:ketosteroid isomerase-like protein